MRLTDEQHNAVQANGLVTLSACPGSGKTVVVVKRIERLMQSGELLSFQGIAATSFTRIARDSIINSLSDIVGATSYPNYVGTLDGFLNSFFFNPYSSLVSATGQKMSILDVDSTWLSDNIFPRYKRDGIVAEKVTYRADGSLIYPGRANISQATLTEIKNRTRSLNLATQSDVNYYALRLLRENENVAKRIINRFPHLIIDEAQDCSEIQMEIVNKLIERGHTQILLAGDPYQSIYEWRDARPELYIEKTQSPEWTSHSLSFNQRSGQPICDILNKFSEPGNITTDPERTELSDAKVEFITERDPGMILSSFAQKCTEMGIEIKPANAAVLYRTHSSVMNVNNKLELTNDWWRQTVNGMSLLGTVALPIKIAIHMESRKYSEAYKECRKFFYFQLFRSLPKNSDENRESLNHIEIKKILWGFCKNIPSLNSSLYDWINSVNELASATYQTLRDAGAGEDNPFIQISKKRGFNDNPNILDFLSASEFDSQNFLMENIHQIKGRTFQAVLIHLKSDGGRWMSAPQLSKTLVSKQMFTGVDAEDARCFYVACSRARRLLCIATDDNELRRLLS